jgi:hypothetical protein
MMKSVRGGSAIDASLLTEVGLSQERAERIIQATRTSA